MSECQFSVCCKGDATHGRKPLEWPGPRIWLRAARAGADVVLGMVPLARELLRMGAEVVLVANSLPAINDITAPELRALLDAAGALCPTIKARGAGCLVPH
jgi:hypothetical protein